MQFTMNHLKEQSHVILRMHRLTTDKIATLYLWADPVASSVGWPDPGGRQPGVQALQIQGGVSTQLSTPLKLLLGCP